MVLPKEVVRDVRNLTTKVAKKHATKVVGKETVDAVAGALVRSSIDLYCFTTVLRLIPDWFGWVMFDEQTVVENAGDAIFDGAVMVADYGVTTVGDVVSTQAPPPPYTHTTTTTTTS